MPGSPLLSADDTEVNLFIFIWLFVSFLSHHCCISSDLFLQFPAIGLPSLEHVPHFSQTKELVSILTVLADSHCSQNRIQTLELYPSAALYPTRGHFCLQPFQSLHTSKTVCSFWLHRRSSISACYVPLTFLSKRKSSLNCGLFITSVYIAPFLRHLTHCYVSLPT